MALVDRRIGLLFLGFLLLLSLAVGRAGYLGVFRADALQQAARLQQVSTEPIPGVRGTITDRDGVPLALSESADEVIADPLLIQRSGVSTRTSPTAIATRIAPLLGMAQAKVLDALTKPNTGYWPVAYDVPASRAGQIGAMRINGLSLKPIEMRVYPRGTEAAQVLGFVGSADVGLGGIEQSLNAVLDGRSGSVKVTNDAVGQQIQVDRTRPMVPGKTVALTIDSPLQNEVQQVLAGVGAEYHPAAATAIVMNPNNSQILALANWPAVNANHIGSIAATTDQAVDFSYEPGSTFKAITVAGALSDGLVTPGTEINVPSELEAGGGFTVQDDVSHPDEDMTVANILKVSSNIGADEIAKRMGPSNFNAWVRRFGFGSSTGIALPGEQSGIILNPQQYSEDSMYNLPFGQGESVTPIQMMQAYSAIANGGILRTPQIVASIGGRPVPTPKGRRVISAKVASELRDMLRGVLADGGTASGAAIPGYDLAGKTGTAQVVVDGRYSNSEFNGSFIGMVPANRPKLVIAVVLKDVTGGIGYGGTVAAPAFKDIVGWAVPYLGINPCPYPCPSSAVSPVMATTPATTATP